MAGAAAGTMPDVVGIDGAWVNDFAKQGAIADLTSLMGQEGYDDSELASQIQVNGATYMIPVVNFVYPMFANTDLLTKAGVSGIPATRDDFAAAAKAVTGGDVSGWALPLSLEAPNGIQNDVMSWVWASGRLDADRRRHAQPEGQRRRQERLGVHQEAVGRRRRLPGGPSP